jgi:hypothetical protein
VTARQPLSSGGGQARRARDAQGVPDQAKVDRLPRRCRGQRQPAHRRATAVNHIRTEASVPIPQAFSAPCASVSKHYSSVRGVHLIAECCTVPSAVRAVPALATGTYTARASRSCKYTGGGGQTRAQLCRWRIPCRGAGPFPRFEPAYLLVPIPVQGRAASNRLPWPARSCVARTRPLRSVCGAAQPPSVSGRSGPALGGECLQQLQRQAS